MFRKQVNLVFSYVFHDFVSCDFLFRDFVFKYSVFLDFLIVSFHLGYADFSSQNYTSYQNDIRLNTYFRYRIGIGNTSFFLFIFDIPEAS